MVTKEQIEKMYREMIEIFGDGLPNFEQEPIRFKYYVKLYEYYYKGTKNDGPV
jgi:hypothetical protein